MAEAMTEQEIPKGEEGLVEVLCFLCFPYICAWWDLPYKERIIKCRALRESVEKIKQAGYVQLAEDQSLPENHYVYPYDEKGTHNPKLTIMSQQFEAYRLAQQDMLKSNFRKVKLTLPVNEEK